MCRPTSPGAAVDVTVEPNVVFGPGVVVEDNAVDPDPTPRPFDIPWFVMDSAQAAAHFDWRPRKLLPQILDDIAVHAEQNPDWLRITASS